MRKPFRKTYKFAGYTATIITLLLTLVMGVFFYVEGIVVFAGGAFLSFEVARGWVWFRSWVRKGVG